jgi:hypothetical protein
MEATLNGRIWKLGKIACSNAKQETSDHFLDVRKMVDLGSGAKREIVDIMLTKKLKKK